MLLELIFEDAAAIKSNIQNIFDMRPKYFGFHVKRSTSHPDWCFTVLIFAEEFSPNTSGQNLMKDHIEKVEKQKELVEIQEKASAKSKSGNLPINIEKADRTSLYLQSTGSLVNFGLYIFLYVCMGLL